MSAAYTAPPLRLKKHGLGEPTVLVVWGPLMVGGVYYAATGTIPGAVVLASLPYALLCTTVLMGKHIDKIPWDAADGTHTLPVILGEAAARRVTQAMFVGFYVSVVALVIARVLPVASVLVRAVVPGDAAHVVAYYSQPKPDVSPVLNPVWPLWFAAMSFLVTRRGRRPARARPGHRRDPRLVTAADGRATQSRRRPARSRARRSPARSRSAARSCSAARSPATTSRPAVALGIRFGVAGVLLLGVLARHAAGRCCRRRASGSLAIALGLVRLLGRVDFFYIGLEHGTAAAVALIFYAYPAVVAIVETRHRRDALRARTLVALALVDLGERDRRDRRRQGRDLVDRACCSSCGSVVMFSAYVLVERPRAAVRTDSLTAATWTAIGASVGVTAFGARARRLHDAVGRTRSPRSCANGLATAAAFTLFFVVLDRIGADAHRDLMALEAVTGIVLAAIFLGESVRPVVALGGAAVLAGAVLAALVSPAPVEARERSSPP